MDAESLVETAGGVGGGKGGGELIFFPGSRKSRRCGFLSLLSSVKFQCEQIATAVAGYSELLHKNEGKKSKLR